MEYLTESELNKSCGVPSTCNSLHIELLLICRIACALCHAMLHYTGHASYLIVHHAMFMCWLFTMLFAPFRCCFFGLVPITSCCEDSFDYVCLSSSWTRSSSLRDFRQDDHTLEITTIFAMLVCSLFCYANATMPTTCFQASQIAMSNL